MGGGQGAGIVDAAAQSVYGLWRMVIGFPQLMASVFSGGEEGIDEIRPISPIGLVRLAGPLESTLTLLALVNVFVGILNFIPLYPLGMYLRDALFAWLPEWYFNPAYGTVDSAVLANLFLAEAAVEALGRIGNQDAEKALAHAVSKGAREYTGPGKPRHVRSQVVSFAERNSDTISATPPMTTPMNVSAATLRA